MKLLGIQTTHYSIQTIIRTLMITARRTPESQILWIDNPQEISDVVSLLGEAILTTMNRQPCPEIKSGRFILRGAGVNNFVLRGSEPGSYLWVEGIFQAKELCSLLLRAKGELFFGNEKTTEINK